MQTSQLSAAELSRIVPLLEGRTPGPDFLPATDHGCGGPILEREDIQTTPMPAKGRSWAGVAVPRDGAGSGDWKGTWQEGPTKLIAGMRAYVSKRLGARLDEPDLRLAARRREPG